MATKTDGQTDANANANANGEGVNPESLDSGEIDWDAIETEIVETHAQGSKTKRVVAVPPAILRFAQASRDSKEVVTRIFPTEAIAKNFADHMKNAGPHVKPPAGMYVRHEGKSVEYSAGEPRGRKPLPQGDAK